MSGIAGAIDYVPHNAAGEALCWSCGKPQRVNTTLLHLGQGGPIHFHSADECRVKAYHACGKAAVGWGYDRMKEAKALEKV